MYVTITSFMHHPNSSRCVSSGTPLLQCSSVLLLNSTTKLLLHPCCTSHDLVTHTTPSSSVLLNLLSCASPFTGCASLSSYCIFCGLTTCIVLSFLTHNGHSLHLCPFFPHLKHLTSTISCFLIILFFISHCIILLDNTSNLFLGATLLFSFSSLFLQFQARCPNPLQLQHSCSFFPFNFALNEVRACFCLSKLLINELYCCKDMVLCLCKGMEVSLVLDNYNYIC